MGAQLLIYASIYLCACTVVFDLLFLCYIYLDRVLQPRRLAWLQGALAQQLALVQTSQPPDIALQKKLRHRLKNPLWLSTFIDMLDSLPQQQTDVMASYLNQSLAILHTVSGYMRRASVEYQAQAAYLIYRMQLGRSAAARTAEQRAKLHEIAEDMVSYVVAPSVFLRENAFKAVISTGDLGALRHAFHLFCLQPELVNQRLIANDLLEYPGHFRKLEDIFIQDFPEYPPALQVAVLNYTRLKSSPAQVETYLPAILALLENQKTNGEVRLAAIRVFRKFPYPAAQPVLIHLLQSTAAHNFAAVAATALQSYPGPETEAALIKGLSSRDWYVRYNCADSLLMLGIDYEKAIRESSDPFARDMLIFRSEVTLLKNQEVSDQ